MSGNGDDKGLWYWLVLSKPQNYWLAKAIGGKAAQDADSAMEDLGQGLVVFFFIAAIGLIAYVILQAFGLLG